VIQVQEEREALQTQLAVAEGRVRGEADSARQARAEVARLEEEVRAQLAVAEGRIREEVDSARQARAEVARLEEEVRMLAAAEVVTLVHATGQVLEVLQQMETAERHSAQASFKAACTSSLRPHTLVA
jgi:hypothetical protein